MTSKVLPIHHSGIPSERGVCLLAELPPVGNIKGDRIVVEDQNYATYVWYGTEWKNPMFATNPLNGGSALVGADGVPISVFDESVFAIAGDSIGWDNVHIASGSYRKTARGPVAKALTFIGQPFDIQPGDNFAVAGTTSAYLVATELPLILAAIKAGRNIEYLWNSCGTNDFGAGITAAQTIANLTTFFVAMKNVGVKCAFRGITPIGTGALTVPADVSFTARKSHNATVNAWARNMHQAGLFTFTDACEVYADNSTAFGNALVNTTYDGLHPNDYGATLESFVIRDWLVRCGVRPAMWFAAVQGDVFDRTLNIYGVLGGAGANPLLQGGSGAPSGTGWAAAGGTWSKVSRALPNGQNRSDPSCALAASTTHTLTFDWTASGAWSATQLQPGDVIELRALVKLNSAAGVRSLQLLLAEFNGSTTINHFDMYQDSADLIAKPYAGTEYLWFRVPKVPVRAYVAAGNAFIRSRLQIDTTAAGAGSVQVLAFEPRIVTPVA